MQNFLQKIQEIKLENALYIISTPIGNLGDITMRALKILQDVDFIICEDSRVSSRLLKSYEIEGKKLLVYNDHNGEKSRKHILDHLVNGHSVALVSDAGTPLISDPGYKLVNFLRKFNQKIIPIPGASAINTALCASGLASDNFLFLGFLPNSKIQKANALKALPRNFTFIIFESPSRVLGTLKSIKENLGSRRICVARELTKLYEQIISDEGDEVIKFFEENSKNLRGEFVIIVEKGDKNQDSLNEDELLDEISKAIEKGHTLKDLSQNLSEIYNINKKKIYQLALKITNEKPKKQQEE